MSEKAYGEHESKTVFGAKFRKLRELFSFTRNAYAKELNMTVANMRTIEAGSSNATIAHAQKIRRHPKLAPYLFWLLDDSEENTDNPEIVQTLDTPVFKDLIITIVEAIEETVKKNNCNLTPEKKGELIYILYCQSVKAGKVESIDWDSISMLIEFALKK
jgi:transcriptional regulator with XRE-family HTH domain